MDSTMPHSPLNQDVDSYHHDRKFSFKFSALEVETLLLGLDYLDHLLGDDESNSSARLNLDDLVYRAKYNHGFKFPIEYLTTHKQRYLDAHLGILVDRIHEAYFDHISSMRDAVLTAKYPQLVELFSPELSIDDVAVLLPSFIENRRGAVNE